MLAARHKLDPRQLKLYFRLERLISSQRCWEDDNRMGHLIDDVNSRYRERSAVPQAPDLLQVAKDILKDVEWKFRTFNHDPVKTGLFGSSEVFQLHIFCSVGGVNGSDIKVTDINYDFHPNDDSRCDIREVLFPSMKEFRQTLSHLQSLGAAEGIVVSTPRRKPFEYYSPSFIFSIPVR